MDKLTREDKAAKAAILLTIWTRSPRRTLSVTYKEFTDYLVGVNVKRVAHSEGTPVYVVVDKKEAIEFLSKKYQLYNVTTGNLCRDITGK